MTEMPVERSWDVVPVGTGRVRPARVLQRHHRVLPCRPVQDERHLLRQRQGDFTKKLEPSLMKQCKLACWGGVVIYHRHIVTTADAKATRSSAVCCGGRLVNDRTIFASIRTHLATKPATADSTKPTALSPNAAKS